MVSAILVAAGLSRRMGKPNKLTLPFAHRTIVETTADHILDADISELIVVTGHENDRIHALLANKPLKITHNPLYASGMTSSIQAGIQAASESAHGYAICLADMPLLQTAEYNLLIDAFTTLLETDTQAILLPTFDGNKGNPVIFSSAYKQQILDHAHPEGCREIIQANKAHVHFLQMPTNHILIDIDSKDEYDRIIKS